MSFWRQRSFPLGGRYRQVSLYDTRFELPCFKCHSRHNIIQPNILAILVLIKSIRQINCNTHIHPCVLTGLLNSLYCLRNFSISIGIRENFLYQSRSGTDPTLSRLIDVKSMSIRRSLLSGIFFFSHAPHTLQNYKWYARLDAYWKIDICSMNKVAHVWNMSI